MYEDELLGAIDSKPFPRKGYYRRRRLTKRPLFLTYSSCRQKILETAFISRARFLGNQRLLVREVAGLEGQLRFAFKVGFNVLAESAIPPVLISSYQLVFFCITLPFRSGQVPCLEIDPRLFAFYF